MTNDRLNIQLQVFQNIGRGGGLNKDPTDWFHGVRIPPKVRLQVYKISFAVELYIVNIWLRDKAI